MPLPAVCATVNKVAAGFLALGLRRGDRIGIWAPNCSEWYVSPQAPWCSDVNRDRRNSCRVLTQLAAAKAGLILVNINPAYRTNELKYALSKVRHVG